MDYVTQVSMSDSLSEPAKSCLCLDKLMLVLKVKEVDRLLPEQQPLTCGAVTFHLVDKHVDLQDQMAPALQLQGPHTRYLFTLVAFLSLMFGSRIVSCSVSEIARRDTFGG